MAVPTAPVLNPFAFATLAEIAAGETARVDLCRVTAPRDRAGRLVAVKRLHADIAEDPTFAKQFADEVRLTHLLRHPNAVEVVAWGNDKEGSYLAVELVQGVSLLRLMKTVFETREAFTERLVVFVGSRVCRGLAAAHALRAPSGEHLQLVHRNLTPGNVLVSFVGEVKITDFGMAKANQRLTQTMAGQRKGEPTYMAPEQAHSDYVDARADIFSLGVILFELFAGRRPWLAKNDHHMLEVIVRDPPADLLELRPKLDPQLAAIVHRCLERDPGARWQSAEEIGRKFDEWLGLHGYQDGNEEAVARFVRRNAMRQMRWFERAITGKLEAETTREVPRVPTYTEDSELPPDVSAVGGPVPPPPRSSSGSGRPLGPRPQDPRSLRAASAVQELKKLAPPVEPRGRVRQRLPTLDDGATDVEMRIPTNKLQTLVPMEEDDDADTGEEVPTLVQPDHPEIAAMRAKARRARESAKLGAPPVSLVEDIEDPTTSLKRAQADGGGVVLEAAADVPQLLSDDDEDHPTRPRADVYVELPPRRDAGSAGAVTRPEPAAEGPTDVRATVSHGRAEGRDARAAFGRPIPRAPEIPQRPATVRPQAEPRVEPEGALAETAGPVGAPPSAGPSPEPAHQHASAVPQTDREAILAEADQLSIEAVRSAEEARAAQVRAERKAVMARAAGEAARIAAEAVTLLQTDGLVAARARLAEARTASKAASSSAPGGSVFPAALAPSIPAPPLAPSLPSLASPPALSITPQALSVTPQALSITPQALSVTPPAVVAPVAKPAPLPVPAPVALAAPTFGPPPGAAPALRFDPADLVGSLDLSHGPRRGGGAVASAIAVCGLLLVVVVIVVLLGR